MLLEYAAAFLRAHGPRCAPAAGDAVVGGRDSFYRFKEPTTKAANGRPVRP
jgi:hypothetical protein